MTTIKLKQFMDKNEITPMDLAYHTKTTPVTISNWLTAKRSPTIDTAQKLYTYLSTFDKKVDILDLFKPIDTKR